MMLLFLQDRSTLISLSRSYVNFPTLSCTCTFDFAAVYCFDSNLSAVDFTVSFEYVAELSGTYFFLENINIDCFWHFRFIFYNNYQSSEGNCQQKTILNDLQSMLIKLENTRQ